ncbi:MAG TPA: tetratricopeptide repeat protein [Dongiaceae bacterium]|nr:tetratricopeptide repeat protein [Dongiaceae bacterium]
MEQTRMGDAMKRREQERCSRMVTIAGYLLLATGLALAAGCATAGKANIPLPAATAQTSSAGPSVVRFTDGREGFVITEPAGMDAQLRAEFDKAVAMIREGKHDKAIELLEKVIAQSPETTAPRINAAIAYRQINKPEQAEQHLKKALELIPGHPVASNEYGLLLRKAGRFTESRLIYEKSLKTFPEYQPIHRNLGVLCDLYLKDFSCAIEHYEIYGNAMPKDKQVKLWLADLNTRSGRKVAASVSLQTGSLVAGN